MPPCVAGRACVVAAQTTRVAADLGDELPGARIEPIRLGTAAPAVDAPARDRVRAVLGVGERGVLFSAFGKITAEKRIGAIVRAFTALAAERSDVHLLLAGDASEYPALARDLSSSSAAARIHVSGYLDDAAVEEHLATADASVCLR